MISGISCLEDFKKNNISFITFNYDRILEYLLYQSTRNVFTLNSDKEIDDACRSFMIFHIYGCIDDAPWQNQQFVYGEHNALVGASITFRKMAASRIKVIGDSKRADDQEINNATALIQQADAVYFLGFSYDVDNLTMLGVPDIFKMSAASIYGTALGMLENKRFEIENFLRASSSDNHIRITDCATLLQMFPLV